MNQKILNSLSKKWMLASALGAVGFMSATQAAITPVLEVDQANLLGQVSDSDLINGNAGTASGTWIFAPAPALTDGSYGGEATGGVSADAAETGYAFPAATIVFDLGVGDNSLGYDITSFVSFAGWNNTGQFWKQDYQVSFFDLTNTIIASATTDVFFDNGGDVASEGGSMVTITGAAGTIASGVRYVSFTQGATLASGTTYRELDVFGASTAVPEPGTYALFAGLLGLTYVMIRRRK